MTENRSKWIESRREPGGKPLKSPKIGFGNFAWKVGQKTPKGFDVSTWPIGCDTPSPFSERFYLGEHAKWRCDTPPPHKRGIAVTRYHVKTRQMGAIPPSTILSRKGLCDLGGISHWAAKPLPKTFVLGFANFGGFEESRKLAYAVLCIPLEGANKTTTNYWNSVLD